MTPQPRTRRKPHPFWRSIVECASVMFLFYANLLMGEFTRANGRGKTLLFALHDVFTWENFTIGLVCACIGYAVFEFWRRKLAYLPDLHPRESRKGAAEGSHAVEKEYAGQNSRGN